MTLEEYSKQFDEKMQELKYYFSYTHLGWTNEMYQEMLDEMQRENKESKDRKV